MNDPIKINGITVTQEKFASTLEEVVCGNAAILAKAGLIPVITVGVCPCGCGRMELIMINEAKQAGPIKDGILANLKKFVPDYEADKGFRHANPENLN